MKTYTVELTDTEDKALSYAALSQQDWIDNVVKNRCRIAIDEIVKITVDKCLEVGKTIPSDRDQIVQMAFAEGWVKTAVERNAEAEAEMANITPE